MSRTALLAAIAVLLVVQASPARAQTAPPDPDSEKAENSGEDLTRPLTRLDMRVKYKDDGNGVDEEFLTLRADTPFRLDGGWQLSTRMDIPLAANNKPGPENPTGGHELGLGDMLAQMILITPPLGKWAFGAGARIVLPTGTEPRFTGGKLQLVPTVAVARQLPELSKGSSISLVLRDTVSVAGASDRSDINTVSVQPQFTVQLPQRWFLTFQPEMKFDVLNHWAAFVPFDMSVGKKVTDSIVVSLQGDVGLIKEKADYDYQFEFRVGFFF